MEAIASEIMWDAILASVPEQKAVVPPATPPTLSRATLAPYAGRYGFAPPGDLGDTRFGSVGVNIAVAEDGARIVDAIERTQAVGAGIVTGDVITHVDGEALAGLTLNQMLDKLRGPVGSSARLRLRRKDQTTPLDIALMREANKPILEVRAEEGRLVIEAVGGRDLFEFKMGKPIVIIPLSETAFYVDGRYRTQINFVKDASGKVSGAILNPGPWEQKGVRVD